MERIRKALDLARAERSRRGVDRGGVEPFDRTTPVASHETAADARAFPRAGDRPAKRFAPSSDVLERRRILRQDSTSPAAEAFRLLRTQLLHRMVERGWRSLAVTAVGADENRAGVAVNLATAIAADPRHHSMCVDLDLRAPRIAELFGLEPEVGVEQVLAGEATVDAALYRPEGYEHVVLLPARAPLPRASELLASPVAREFVRDVRERYSDRYVIYSVAPVLGSDDALSFLPAVDCALLVVTEGMTRRADLARAMDLLRRVPVVGTVLSDALAAGRSTE